MFMCTVVIKQHSWVKLFSMVDVVKNNLDKINSVCKKYGVKSLYLFGSATNGDFNDQSDIDFLVEYYRDEEGIAAKGFDYFDVLFSLEQITGRKIDLVVNGAVRNPFFKQKLDEQKVLLYAA